MTTQTMVVVSIAIICAAVVICRFLGDADPQFLRSIRYDLGRIARALENMGKGE
jgi:hypothetical protein